ncbi:hypothetical protein GY45DRAFT_1138431 [Cubamyces sp. BRFM 1775]|nr:hypothetical protein GY45DRAFT_1138431 [Cubamyces sp. BRFM 1775]
MFSMWFANIACAISGRSMDAPEKAGIHTVPRTDHPFFGSPFLLDSNGVLDTSSHTSNALETPNSSKALSRATHPPFESFLSFTRCSVTFHLGGLCLPAARQFETAGDMCPGYQANAFPLATTLSGVYCLRDSLSLDRLDGAMTSELSSLTAAESAMFPTPNGASTPTPTGQTTTPAAGTSAPDSVGTSTTLAAVTNSVDDANPTQASTSLATTTSAADDSDPGTQQNQWTPTTSDTPAFTPTPSTSVHATSSPFITDTMTSEPSTTVASVPFTTASFMKSAATTADSESIMSSPTNVASEQHQHGISMTVIVEVVAICLACLCALILSLLLWRVLRRRKRDSMSFGDPELGPSTRTEMTASTEMNSHIPALPNTGYNYEEDLRWRQMPLVVDTGDTGSDMLQSEYGKNDPSNYDTPTEETAEGSMPMRESSSTLSYIDALCPETAQLPAPPSTPTTLPRYVPQSRPLPVPEGLDSPFASIYSAEERMSTVAASIIGGSVDSHAGDTYPRPMAVYDSVLGHSSFSLDHRASWVVNEPPPDYSRY